MFPRVHAKPIANIRLAMGACASPPSPLATRLILEIVLYLCNVALNAASHGFGAAFSSILCTLVHDLRLT